METFSGALGSDAQHVAELRESARARSPELLRRARLPPTLSLVLGQHQGLAYPQADPLHWIPESEDREVTREGGGPPFLAQHFPCRLLLEHVEYLPPVIREVNGVGLWVRHGMRGTESTGHRGSARRATSARVGGRYGLRSRGSAEHPTIWCVALGTWPTCTMRGLPSNRAPAGLSRFLGASRSMNQGARD